MGIGSIRRIRGQTYQFPQSSGMHLSVEFELGSVMPLMPHCRDQTFISRLLDSRCHRLTCNLQSTSHRLNLLWSYEASISRAGFRKLLKLWRG